MEKESGVLLVVSCVLCSVTGTDVAESVLRSVTDAVPLPVAGVVQRNSLEAGGVCLRKDFRLLCTFGMIFFK